MECPDTTIKLIIPVAVTFTTVLSIVLAIVFAGLLTMYIIKKREFNKSEEHQEFLKYKLELKNKK